jgi:hypothetical protein
MRKSKMTILGCIGIFLIAVLILVPAAQAGEKTFKYKVVSHTTKVEMVPVPDVEKHAVGLFEKKGVAIYENGETAAYDTRGTFDFIKGQGPWDGYCQISYADGSTIITKYQGTSTIVEGKKLLKGEGKYIKGTGRFEGIKGKFSLAGKYITKAYSVVDVTGTYTLPKK